MKIGDKVWIVEDKEAVEITVEFVGDSQIAFTLNGKLVSRKNSEVYKDEKEATFSISGLRPILFCRETCRMTGKVAVYKLNESINDYILNCLSIRNRFNPELQYAMTTQEVFEENKENMKNIDFFDKLSEENKIAIL